ncbi:hypothetical protein DL96DRAFT_1717869 [Flagelloscypha sp. PMI_526]|nr:hypothetical protein DL96DRAFT_1717869 [Flagelloscypha sp. PMI_526]
MLPVEILEGIIEHLFDDISSLAACSLASSVFLPICRSLQFYTITLAPISCQDFEAFLQASDHLVQYVRRVHVLDPEAFRGGAKNQSLVLAILSQLSNVTDIFCFDTGTALGISWNHCGWLLEALTALPALQNVVVEAFYSLAELCAWPCFRKIRKLAIFDPDALQARAGVKERVSPSLRISTLRLSELGWNYRIDQFLSSRARNCMDLSGLQHIALHFRSTRTSLESWISGLAAASTMPLQTIVLELQRSFDFVIPFEELVHLKRLWVVFRQFSFDTTDDPVTTWSTWLDRAFSKLPRHLEVEVSIFVPQKVRPELEPPVERLGTRFRLLHLNSRKIWTRFFEIE